ncbi:MAG: DUF4290 domain-containing protein [Breznakibacter sp.]|nr:DUF4290 domain-containing protein [Breznakibacter sp.]
MSESSLDQVQENNRFVYTKKADLTLPEYGRHIHVLVAHALTIADKEERTRCAKSIIAVMGNLFPHLRDVPDFNHKLWDHLAIMSDFKMDIETPFPVPNRESLVQPPAKVPYQHNDLKIKHYGKLVLDMIEQAILETEPDRKRAFIIMLGNHMKKSLAVWNKDSVTDERIVADMKILSKGRLEIPVGIRFVDLREVRENRSAISSSNQGATHAHNSGAQRNNPHKKSMGSKRFDDRRNGGRPSNHTN